MMNPQAPSIHLDSGLEIGYGSPLARFGQAVSLTGGTHFLLARNGRGKTTLLRTLARTLKPVSGNFRAEGFTQYLPEDLRFDPEITPAMIFRTLLPKAAARARRWTSPNASNWMSRSPTAGSPPAIAARPT